MSKEKLKPEERKIKFSITINPLLFNKINGLYTNKSKYIEKIILKDLTNKGLINEDEDEKM